MSEKRKQKILLLSPIAVLFLCLGFVAALFWNMYRQAAFEHFSAFCEIAAQRNPELEPQILSALKAYSALSAQDVRGNHYLAQYGYSGEEFFKGCSVIIFGRVIMQLSSNLLRRLLERLLISAKDFAPW